MYKGFEYINCPLCGQNETELKFTAQVLPHQIGLFSFDEWNIVVCQHCGFNYVNPRITEEVNQQYYKFELDGDQSFIRNHFIDAAAYHIPYWQRMVRVVQKYKQSGNLLDIGCGNGAFLKVARSAGFHVFGQDISDYFVEYNQNENQIFVYNGELDQLNLAEETFDVITCFDVIEHHRNPKALLSEVKRLLKPGGIVIITTHDIGNVFAKFYGSKWRMIYPIGHLTYFSKKTIKRMLSRYDYKIIRLTGANTIDNNIVRELRNSIRSFFVTIMLRTLILLIYKPILDLFPRLKRWKFHIKGKTLTHELVTTIAGEQLISNDELVAIAQTDH